MNLQSAVVVDETQFAELVHEKVDATAGGAHQLGECLLRNCRHGRLGHTFFAILPQKQQRSC